MIQILQGDSVEQLARLPSGSIDLIVTSPPYGELRTYGGPFNWLFQGTAKQLFRVLKEGGVCCWNVGDSVVDGSETLAPFEQAIHFKRVCGFSVHDTMIWEKLNFANPESVRYHQLFEFVFILSKGKPATFNPIKDKRNATAGRIGCLGKNTYAKRDGSRSVRAHTYVTNEFGMRGNVWRGRTRGQEEFCKKLPPPAMMPRWLVRDLVLSWSNAGETVLDPFGGSGTTGEEALKLGRRATLIELNPEYCRLIRQRCDSITAGLPL